MTDAMREFDEKERGRERKRKIEREKSGHNYRRRNTEVKTAISR